MAHINAFGDLYFSYYVCQECGARLPAQQVERVSYAVTPEGNEVATTTRPWAVLCQNPKHPAALHMRRITPDVAPQTAASETAESRPTQLGR